jgi:hypothetical protein
VVASAAREKNGHESEESITLCAKKPGALRTRISHTSEIARKGGTYVFRRNFFL